MDYSLVISCWWLVAGYTLATSHLFLEIGEAILTVGRDFCKDFAKGEDEGRMRDRVTEGWRDHLGDHSG